MVPMHADDHPRSAKGGGHELENAARSEPDGSFFRRCYALAHRREARALAAPDVACLPSGAFDGQQRERLSHAGGIGTPGTQSGHPPEPSRSAARCWRASSWQPGVASVRPDRLFVIAGRAGSWIAWSSAAVRPPIAPSRANRPATCLPPVFDSKRRRPAHRPNCGAPRCPRCRPSGASGTARAHSRPPRRSDRVRLAAPASNRSALRWARQLRSRRQLSHHPSTKRGLDGSGPNKGSAGIHDPEVVERMPAMRRHGTLAQCPAQAGDQKASLPACAPHEAGRHRRAPCPASSSRQDPARQDGHAETAGDTDASNNLVVDLERVGRSHACIVVQDVFIPITDMAGRTAPGSADPGSSPIAWPMAI